MCGAIFASATLACGVLTSEDALNSNSVETNGLAMADNSSQSSGQVVYGISGPLGGIQEGAAVGTVRITDRCIWIDIDHADAELDEPSLRMASFTVVFLDNDYVTYDEYSNAISVYYPVWVEMNNRLEIDPRLARIATLRDGQHVWVASPNAWSREHLSPETLMLRTEPYPECPERFWLPGAMTPVHPLDINERLELPMVPHPAVYAAG